MPVGPGRLVPRRAGRGAGAALVVNSGNANAFTGAAGVATTTAVAKETAKAIGATPNTIFQASTGVIGEPMDPAPIVKALRGVARRRQPGRPDGRGARDHDHRHLSQGRDRARQARRRRGHDQRHRQGRRHDRPRHGDDAVVRLHRRADRRAGAAGAARASRSTLVQRDHRRQRYVDVRHVADVRHRRGGGARRARDRRRRRSAPRRASAARSTNCSSTSPSRWSRDGEGARKFIEVRVAGAATRRAAKRIAFAIANSPLVKTAVAGEDANWGRVVMAVGKAGEKAERDKLDIFFGDCASPTPACATPTTTRRRPPPT